MDHPRSRLLSIPRLFAGAKDVYHLAYYHVPRAGYQDRISRSILDFKDGKEPQQSRWIALATSLLGQAVHPDLIVRRLAPEETRVEKVTSLDLLCEAIAEACDAEFDRARLSKSRVTNSLSDLAGKVARKKELQDAYVFNANGLAEDLKILVVDDITITGSTLEAITCAIKRDLPEAEVSCFVLGRADGRIPNAHLNPAYFSGEAAQPFTSAGTPPEASKERATATNLADTVRMVVPAALRAPVKGKRDRRLKTGILAGLLLLLLVAALAPVRSSKDAMASSDLIPLHEQLNGEEPAPVLATPFEPPAERKVAPAPAQPRQQGPTAIVTVPGAGLRRDHAISSKVIPGTTLRNGERVAVIQRFHGGAGPSWVQVRTKTGKTGWVFASLVHEKR